MSNNIIKDAYDFAIAKKSPPKILFEIPHRKADELIQKYGADEMIVKVGLSLMDICVAQSLREERYQDHVAMSVVAAKGFLQQYELSADVQAKIINCIESHHGVKKYACIEAEVCANADCYKFLHPRGFLASFTIFGGRNMNFEDVLDQVEQKIDEKYGVLSLDVCKSELEPHYQAFKQYIVEARVQAST